MLAIYEFSDGTSAVVSGHTDRNELPCLEIVDRTTGETHPLYSEPCHERHSGKPGELILGIRPEKPDRYETE